MSEEKKETKSKNKDKVEAILKKIDEGEDRILSQNEIDILLTAIASDDEFKPINRTRKIKVYDFERPDKYSKEELREISNVSETIARELTKMFASDMTNAAAASGNERAELRKKAINRDLAYMRTVLDKEQYHKYLLLLNTTMNNRGLNK